MEYVIRKGLLGNLQARQGACWQAATSAPPRVTETTESDKKGFEKGGREQSSTSKLLYKESMTSRFCFFMVLYDPC